MSYTSIIFFHCTNRHKIAVCFRKFVIDPVPVGIHIKAADSRGIFQCGVCSMERNNIPVCNIGVRIHDLMNLFYSPSPGSHTVTVDIVFAHLYKYFFFVVIPLKHKEQISHHSKCVRGTVLRDGPASIPYITINNRDRSAIIPDASVSDRLKPDCVRCDDTVALPHKYVTFLMVNPVTFVYGQCAGRCP